MRKHKIFKIHGAEKQLLKAYLGIARKIETKVMIDQMAVDSLKSCITIACLCSKSHLDWPIGAAVDELIQVLVS